MPISRYEIRNEYSLADPELYRATDKDDPEALLEGVAMAGLVGVLRQLGDLAEFAAEIFHDLHEEVMSTAARGHDLMIRVQQLESEVPSIEKAFLSQTDHSSFFYNAGVDWHPNIRMEQNLITQGDLPRFVMDSYEECRGPPRLFLLDKFDVAGAGSCLKRYTDPSFFKEEISGISGADVQREKKSRRAKKRGQRWRNGETPELLPASHTKLHQLFLEERVENGVSNPARRVKLKKRLNGFPFGSKNGKSYMEKILKTPSPEHKLHEVTPNSRFLMLPAIDHNESGFEVLEVRQVCPEEDSMERKNSHPDEVSRDDKICEVPNSHPTVMTDEISSSLDYVNGEKDIAVVGEIKTEGSLTGYQSDDIASEIDYVDAPSTMESEMDTDSEMRVKSDLTSSFVKTQPLISNADEEDLRTGSLDSQSTGESVISDERNNSSKKETSSFSTSDSPTTSAENTNSEMIIAERFTSTAISEIYKEDGASLYQRTAVEDPVHQNPNPVICDYMCNSTAAVTNHTSDFEQVTSTNLCSTDLLPSSEHLDSGDVGTDRIDEPELDDMALASDDGEGMMNLLADQPCIPSVSDSTSQLGNDSRRSSAEEHAVDEPNEENMTHDRTDSLVATSSDLLLNEEECDREDLNPVENVASSSDMCNAQKRNDTPEIILTEKARVSKLDEDVPKLTEIFWSGRHDKARNKDDTVPTVSKGEKLTDELDNLDSNVFTDSSNRSSYIIEDSRVREPIETSLSNSHNVDMEEHSSNSSIENQICSENLILPHVEDSPELPGEVLDAHERAVFPDDETRVNEIPALETSETCQVEGLQAAEVADDLESSCGTPEDLEEPSGVVDTLENNGTASCMNPVGIEFAEKLHSSDMELLNEVHVPLNESTCEIDKLETEEMASAAPAVSDNAKENDVSLPDVFKNSDLDEHKDGENCLWGIHSESGLEEEVGQEDDTASDADIFICNSTDNDNLDPEAPDNGQSSYHDLDVQMMDSIDAIKIQSPLEQRGFDTEQEIIQPSVSDGSSFLIDATREERTFQEKIELPHNLLHEEFLNSFEINLEPSSVLPIKLLENDDQERDNDSGSLLSPSFSELPGVSSYDINVSGYPKDPLDSILPPSNLVSEANQINLDELPPLPPLPPVQWRMAKLHPASPFTNGTVRKSELVPRVIFPPIGSTNEVSYSREDINRTMVQVAPEIAGEKVEESSSSLVDYAMNETIEQHEDTNHSMVQVAPETAEAEVEESSSSLADNAMNEVIDFQLKMENELNQPATSINVSSSHEGMNLPLIQNNLETTSKDEKLEQSSFNVEGCPDNETAGVPPKIEIKSESKENVSSSIEERNHSPIHTRPETSPEMEKVQQGSSSLIANPMHETVDLPPKIETEQGKLIMPFFVRESTPPADEDGVANGSHKVKLPRPRNPLVEDVALLDKSKLRKVTERVRPQIQQVDERDSLLEQIRTKSFNLKPAMASRPSIRGPRTNLKVAAILEKANAIRQALAGSDEDDDDNWSDS